MTLIIGEVSTLVDSNRRTDFFFGYVEESRHEGWNPEEGGEVVERGRTSPSTTNTKLVQ